MNQEIITKNIISNLIEVMDIAVGYSSHEQSEVKDLQGSFRYFSGCEFPFFNGVFNNYRSQDITVKDDLSELTEFFASRNSPFIWWWIQQSELPEEIKAELDEKRFQFLGEFSGIAAKLDEIVLVTNHDNDIEIKRIATEKEFQQFIAIMCEVFQLSAKVQIDLQAMYSSYGPGGKFIHYLGYYRNEPVATLTSYINGGVVGLYNGATLAQAQKKGLCTSLAQAAIKDALDLNCEYGISQLMAPAMAKGLSEKMGAKSYCRLLPFLKDPRTAAQLS